MSGGPVPASPSPPEQQLRLPPTIWSASNRLLCRVTVSRALRRAPPRRARGVIIPRAGSLVLLLVGGTEHRFVDVVALRARVLVELGVGRIPCERGELHLPRL